MVTHTIIPWMIYHARRFLPHAEILGGHGIFAGSIFVWGTAIYRGAKHVRSRECRTPQKNAGAPYKFWTPKNFWENFGHGLISEATAIFSRIFSRQSWVLSRGHFWTKGGGTRKISKFRGSEKTYAIFLFGVPG